MDFPATGVKDENDGYRFPLPTDLVNHILSFVMVCDDCYQTYIPDEENNFNLCNGDSEMCCDKYESPELCTPCKHDRMNNLNYTYEGPMCDGCLPKWYGNTFGGDSDSDY